MPDENDTLQAAYMLLEASKAVRAISTSLPQLSRADYAALATSADQLAALSARIFPVVQRGRIAA